MMCWFAAAVGCLRRSPQQRFGVQIKWFRQHKTDDSSSARYQQSEYILSGYLDPPLNDASYLALKGANFTGVFGDRTCVCKTSAAASSLMFSES